MTCYVHDPAFANQDKPVSVPSAAALYAQSCQVCHGTEGKGDGPAAHLVFPRPRDFTTGVYRFKSTPGEQLPTIEDLRRIIKDGIDRTAMPSFASVLSDVQIDALGDYILAMQKVQDVAAKREPIVVPAQPKFTPDFIATGKKVYVASGCAACHGEKGQGDGPASGVLKDSGGWPLPPADFTAGVYKAGRTPDALYRVIRLGVPGTPMPGFGDAIKQGFKVEGVADNTDLTWAMVAYMDSLVTKRPEVGAASDATIVLNVAADEAMITDPRHAAWVKVKATNISLRPLWQRRAATVAVSVRVVTIKDKIAIALDWSDSTVDMKGESVHQFSDASAIMFSLSDDPVNLTMGQRGDAKAGEKAALVNLWHWRADRQLNADTNHLHDTVGDDAVAGSFTDLYMFKKGDRTKGPLVEHDSTYVPAWGVDNPKADPALMHRSVLESNAAGFGTLTLQAAKDQGVDGHAVWGDGRWRVVMTRFLKSEGASDVKIVGRSKPVPIAFAIWDGSAGDRNGTKMISGWHWLKMNE